MSETNAIYYSEFSSCNAGIFGSFFSEYATVTTVKTITTVTTFTAMNMFNSSRPNRKCEAIKDGLLISRKPQAKVFGEIELKLLNSIGK
jgi:hypothetical protein